VGPEMIVEPPPRRGESSKEPDAEQKILRVCIPEASKLCRLGKDLRSRPEERQLQVRRKKQLDSFHRHNDSRTIDERLLRGAAQHVSRERPPRRIETRLRAEDRGDDYAGEEKRSGCQRAM